MINQAVLVGRLTKDPELRYTPSGVATATFTLAVNRTFTNQAGEREADFIPVVVWRKQAESVANFMRKGSLVGVVGRIQVRNYENNEGRRVYVTEIVAETVQFLDNKNTDNPNPNQNPQENYQNQRNQGGYNQGYNQPPQGGNARPNPNQGGGAYNQGNGQNQGGQLPPNQGYRDPFQQNGNPIDISDDDMPF